MSSALPVVDVAALCRAEASAADVERAARAIDEACRDVGFFYAVGHGIDPSLQQRLDALSRSFFALPEDEKAEIAMARAGRAWRGWFPVGGELTSGVPDLKEGIYFGAELPADDARVEAGLLLHGANLFPRRPPGLQGAVVEYLSAMTTLGQAILGGMAIGLGRPRSWFEATLTAEPLTLFRVFHYPPSEPMGDDDEGWGVGEHTDYGLLTILAQDDNGGLEVRTASHGWVAAPPVEGAFVCNLGDMLERLTDGRYRSTPHRVRNTSGRERLSFPFFLDPSWDAVVGDDGSTYGDYITAKVGRVFPDLGKAVR